MLSYLFYVLEAVHKISREVVLFRRRELPKTVGIKNNASLAQIFYDWLINTLNIIVLLDLVTPIRVIM